MTISNNKAYSILEFCEIQGISASMFYKLMRQGKGPRTMLIGSRRFVLGQAIVEWQSEMEEKTTATF